VVSFRATLQLHGKTATGVEVPDAVVAALSSGKRPAVMMTVNGHTWRNTVAVMGGQNLLGVSAENRSAAGIVAGDVIDIELELDTAKREVEVPEALALALAENKTALAAFTALSYSNQRRHTLAVEAAKTEETRVRRIAKIIDELSS
jgi:hypothetical protein